ncbi:bifunctional diaminohydroxyphosphoribosylaminopyrimidine deaminase/5-amino-6-(5-phosphoribosylamino)uracil reductase RibD [Pseudoalteromonas tunicata]|uniref:bifunctional diaminohydroxyphosphoribosylaminopyrimidine deaminase/5-amino-6-(5-phosphoribosylamino)uracil reductase RibD n=1 Tax=Pseudoalteromonas tunicata TaxID=314281 RepID=UPI00273D684D|nr:bifunctional diaminohydroxyphosphoribosylaminopyrimidine deaminase/5-amino-6-(5-phosphoribosylamino)uracil reductase RibD [Pseudoalteromonas tunicata]MDP4982419.1 bifunctional diaminohydroxyphosphoribosylaminopyrimidine deaminase/5-amino-6-(5-phosphoribosylamino)uracil reductase RibD [Pseudoalteromonas tunicata]
MSFTALDYQYMALAIELAKKGRYTTSPNPNVGCVLVKDGQIVGQGYHQKAGEGHAEVHALAQAKELALGATAYVTLEPCSHTGRTGPCALALVNAGVIKVIAAMVDPNPAVSGRGLAILEKAGIQTAHGLMQVEAEALNVGFLKRMRNAMPFVQCKLAASLDGKTALANGQSKWITGPLARAQVQDYRAQSCAVLTGADTVLVDNAKMNVRYDELINPPFSLAQLRQPIRVVIDSKHRLTPDLAFFQIESPVIILTTKLDISERWPHFVSHLLVPELNGQVDLSQAMQLLGARGINHIWLEAGHTLAGQMAQQGLVDQFIFYLAPKLIGHSGKSLLQLPVLESMAEVTELSIDDVSMVGVDLKITASYKKSDH